MAAQRRSKSSRIDTSFLILLALVAATTLWAFVAKGTQGILDGLLVTWRLIVNSGPDVLVGMVIAAMIQSLVPARFIAKWMGESSGLLGVVVGAAAGVISPGGPYITYPIVASLLGAGAGVGPISGFIAIRNLASINRVIIWDLPFLGGPFSIARIVCSIPLAIGQILLVPIVFKLMPAGAREAARRKFAQAKPPVPGERPHGR